ncbi:hypothetical protein EZV61_09405 [Corallincola luteus]|uniref:A-factor biosynthesis hotdog domain-containing protein n=1 Tax=Corallincola luteus TaxID=1775177 RepID=A0ABY2ALY7_9GAMM|nr:AfsA-related hotdog domain-containing protein [Corallincola luteus]TCI03746.1 hypothetical protein EZV61_09405 [Corallincola luteus]
MDVRNVRLVVGDKFTNFHRIPSCILYSDWKQLRGVNRSLLDSCIFIPGLGLNKNQVDDISRELPIELQHLSQYDLASQSQTHKHNIDNILVTTPEQIDDFVFESKMMVQDCNELILDHATGFHLPGMLFLEATRQMATSAVDLLFHGENKYYVMHDIKADYLNFAFPIDTTVTLELIQERSEDGERAFRVNLSFHQNGKKVVTTSGSFSSVDKESFALREERFAQITTNKICRRLKNDAEALLKQEEQCA